MMILYVCNKLRKLLATAPAEYEDDTDSKLSAPEIKKNNNIRRPSNDSQPSLD